VNSVLSVNFVNLLASAINGRGVNKKYRVDAKDEGILKAGCIRRNKMEGN
jgi:hypothetical protein